jgi:predicted heme/steroid binding protein
MVGVYQGMSGAGGFIETWQIKMDKGAFAVIGTFHKGNQAVGAFQGKNVKYADGALTFEQSYVKKPDPTWSDGTEITATVSGDKLSFTWKNSGQSGKNSLDRLATVDQFGGAWQGMSSVGGFTETWQITIDKNKVIVLGRFEKDGMEVGSFQGRNVKFANGTLTFTQKYKQKPAANWSDGNVVSAKLSGDKLTFAWKNGKQTGTGELERGKP